MDEKELHYRKSVAVLLLSLDQEVKELREGQKRLIELEQQRIQRVDELLETLQKALEEEDNDNWWKHGGEPHWN